MAKPGMGLLVLGGKPESEDSGGMTGGGAESAAKAVIKAVKAGDAAALSEALQLHYELCQSPSEGEDEE